ncbi:MAG: uracil-DNA glycosylase family protein [Hyphomicrobiales bacterium]|nr:uracil-DNA glycosylase family protein [Rickettsiales bacterium]MCP5361538.1 uracil-DNA glycosylase family protein [Hyphomicrobiales bacterium]
MTLPTLLQEVYTCTHCRDMLPFAPNPVLRAGEEARILIVGQAPGTKVHATGIPWNDASGNRLRVWLNMPPEQFYDTQQVAIIPMGFCYPGKGSSGDLPPRPECAPLWHPRLLATLPNIRLTLLIGHYAQAYYLGNTRKKTLKDTVAAWEKYQQQGFFPLVHPSPRNQRWLRNNPWFEKSVIPALRNTVQQALHSNNDHR